MITIAIALLALPARVGALTPAVPSAALMQWSFDICAADTICSAVSFPVNGDFLMFQQMMLAWLARRPDGGVDMVAYYETCVGAFPFPPASSCSDQWLWEMRGAQPCGVNEEWIEDVGCQCIQGRNCALDCIHLSSSKSLSLIVILAVIGLFVAVVFTWIVKNYTALFKFMDALAQQLRDLQARNTAQIYIEAAGPRY